MRLASTINDQLHFLLNFFSWHDRFSLALFFLFSGLTFFNNVQAIQVIPFGPVHYSRQTGPPIKEDAFFTVNNLNGSFSLTVYNGGFEEGATLGKQVSSGTITLNGVIVIGPQDFNQNVPTIHVPVNLASSNHLTVKLNGKPGRLLTIKITGEVNTSPIADAGDNQIVTSGSIITLDGSASSDLDGDLLAYRWALIGKPSASLATISNANGVTTNFTADIVGDYVAELVVNDGTINSLSSQVLVSALAQNHPPALSPIGNQVIELGTTLTVNLNASDEDSDPLSYSVKPLPLPTGATLDGESGIFHFKPEVEQIGSIDLAFSVSDGILSDSEIITLTIPHIDSTASTRFSGRLLDANDYAQGHITPIVGTTISFLNTSQSVQSDTQGFFFLTDLPEGIQVLDIDSSTAVPAPDGSLYAGFRENYSLIANVENINERPFYMPRLDQASLTTIDPASTTVVNSEALGISLTVPAHTAKNSDGSDFTGELSISLVPRDFAPAALPDFLDPGLLVTIQPVGISFSTPASLSFPNIDNLEPGSEVDIWSVDPALGEFTIVGTGQVSTDGLSIETIAGGINATDWHSIVPSQPNVSGSPNEKEALNQKTCHQDQTFSTSTITTLTGCLNTGFNLPNYLSQGKNRGLSFIYKSRQANPIVMIPFDTTIPVQSAVPPQISYQIEVGGVKIGTETFVSTDGFSENLNETLRGVAHFNASDFSTGVYPYQIQLTNYFSQSSIATTINDRVVVINEIDNPLGAGWGLMGISRLYTVADGSKLIVSGDGSTQHYSVQLETSEIVTTGGMTLVPPPMSTVQGIYESNSEIRVFLEANNKLLSEQVPVDISLPGVYTLTDELTPGVLSAGTEVNSFYIHYDGLGTSFNQNSGTITFPFEILGIVGQDLTLLQSDAILGLENTKYSTEVNHGNEFSSDFVTLSNDLKTLTHQPQLEGQTDHLRVITRPGSFESREIFITNAGDYSELAADTSSGYILTHKNGTKIHFNNDGLQTEVIDRNGNTTQYDYDSLQRLVAITDPAGQITMLTYINEHLNTVTDPAGRSSYFEHDQNGNLIKIIFPDGSFKGFGYDDRHLMTFETDPRGYSAIREYDASGRISSATRADGSIHTASHAQSIGLVDLDNGFGTTENPATLVRPDTVESLFTNGEGHTKHSNTDSFGRIIRRTDANNLTTTIERDENGNATRITRPDGSIINRTFDPQGNLRSTIESFNNATTLFDYDPTYNLLTSVTNALNQTTDYHRDDKGDLSSIVNPMGHTTTFTHNSVGLVTQTTDPNGLVTDIVYNTAGLPAIIAETPPANGGLIRSTEITYDHAGSATRIITLPDGLTVDLTYDQQGRLLSVTDLLNQTIEYSYDASGNRIGTDTKETDGTLTATISQTFDALNRLTTVNQPHIKGQDSVQKFHFDGADNLAESIDANMNSSSQAYDPGNRLIERIDAQLGSTTFSYNTNGQINQIVAPNGSITDYQFDALDRVISETSADRGTLSYRYDLNNNLSSMTDARGISTSYHYDELNRLTEVQYPDSTENISLSYDHCSFGIGRLCRMIDASGSSELEYDAYGNITQITQQREGISYSQSYQYDGGHRLSSITFPSGRELSYSRDSLQRIQGMTTEINHLSQSIIDNVVYNAANQIIQRNYGNGLVETRSYDQQSRLLQQTLQNIDQTGLSYDANSNILIRNTSTDNHSYSYDALDRLIQENNDSIQTAYDYDANNNRTQETQSTQSIFYDYAPESNQLEIITTGSTSQSLLYDAAGNLIQDAQGRQYSYNEAGRLKDIQNNGQTQVEYRYNGMGQRSHKIINEQITLYHYDLNNQLIAETQSNGTPIRDYIWYDNIPVAQIDYQNSTETLSYLHTDQLNTPRLATSQNQAIVWRWEGDAFAKAPPQNLGTTIHLRFPGQYYDTESGLHYNYFRYYDPSIGRYITSDPIGLTGGLNTYAYVNGNPLLLIDPLGLFGTQSCTYYQQACTANRGVYECNVASSVCPIFPDNNNPTGEDERIGNWSECVRQCLQETHKERMSSPQSCSLENNIDPDDNLSDHVNCFSGCSINPENPYNPFFGSDLPDANPSLF